MCSAGIRKFRGKSGIPENEDRNKSEHRSECFAATGRHWIGKRVGNAEGAGAFRSFSRVMFKILHITSNILNVKLDEEGEGS